MSYCNFHPATAATWHCPHCQYDLCDTCVDEGMHNDDHRCMSCNNHVDSLGAAHSAAPFWRRLEESFKYPMKTDAIIMIVGAAILNGIFSLIPMGFFLSIAIFGAVLSYSFECMRQTANGKMSAPDINNTYKGHGNNVLGKLFLIFIALGCVAAATKHVLGNNIAAFIDIILLLAIPAIVILYGLSESVVEALNPKSITGLIKAIGMPYGLILAFIMIMASSVGVIHSLLSVLPYLSSTLQTMVSYYYMIVMFHIMGYMIFQNQGELGYTARENNGESGQARTAIERTKSRIKLYIKEGRYDEVIELYEQAIKSNPDNRNIVDECFNFLLGTHNKEFLQDFSSFYLEHLIKHNETDQLVPVYKRALLIMPGYVPDTAELRHALAQVLYERGDFKVAIKMLNGLHTKFPQYEHISEAYLLMANCLDTQPDMQAQAEKFRAFAKKYKPATA